MADRLSLRLDGFDPTTARRMITTASCTDCDEIDKVAGAGESLRSGETIAQVMHNGLLVEWGGYYGEWMAEIIRVLRGHHEPQEEVVFDRVLGRLAAEENSPVMVEFGSFWTYYGLWFLKLMPSSSLVAVEPDAAWLEVGRRNAALNGLSERARFVHAAIGPEPGCPLQFRAESDGQLHTVAQHDLSSLLDETGLGHVDLLLCDAQGAESVLLERAGEELIGRKVRFLFVSTHHQSISGDPLTHQRCLALLQEAGGHVIAEHSVRESFSGDGLIVVSFDPRDRDFSVEVSYARARDSLFGEAEVELADALSHNVRLEQELAHSKSLETEMETNLVRSQAESAGLRAELDALQHTKLMRWSRPARQLYSTVTRRAAGR
jgi:FkbM family methyltransferase